MSRENMMEVMRIMQNQIQKKETEVQLLKMCIRDRVDREKYPDAKQKYRFELVEE